MKSSDPNRIHRDIVKSLESAVDDLLQELNTEVRRATPKRSGYASKQWRYSRPYDTGYTGTVIENRASYIALLDAGSSKQAPDGIVEPALKRLLRRQRKL